MVWKVDMTCFKQIILTRDLKGGQSGSREAEKRFGQELLVA